MVYLNESCQHKTILIVNNNLHNSQLIAEFLVDYEYKVSTAQTGYDAIKIANSHHIDLILLDVLIIDIDGFTICSRLKNNPDTQNIPIIFVTALGETKSKVRGFAAGAVDYITKPIDREELLARIQTHLRLQSLYQRSIQDTNRQRLLLEISDRIRQSLDLRLIMETAVAEIRSFLNCQSVWLTRLDGNDILLETFASTVEKSSPPLETWQYICSSPKECLLYQQGNIKTVELNNPLQKIEASAWLNSSVKIILPVLIGSDWQPNSLHTNLETTPTSNHKLDGDTLWGWLILDYDRCSQWQSDEIELLRMLANQLAMGIKQGLLFQKLFQQARVDPLTQIYNRRYFDLQIHSEWRRLQRTASSLSLILCDVDYFKLYNDTYGHQQGDRCLQKIALAISSAIRRPADSLARIGGEEFVVILPLTHRAGAVRVAENIRQAVRNLNLPHLRSKVDSVVTVSIGVAQTIPNIKNHSRLLLEAADLALYDAKDKGRNCVAVHSSPISIVKRPASFRKSVNLASPVNRPLARIRRSLNRVGERENQQ